MKQRFNFYLIHYALSYIFRYKNKNIFVGFILMLLTALLASVLFLSSALKYELLQTTQSLGDIVVQNTKAMMHDTMDEDVLDDLLAIHGVKNGVARVWGYYHFSKDNINFLVVGVDPFDTQYGSLMKSIAKNFELNSSTMIVGSGVKKILEQSYYSDYFHFIRPDGSIKKLSITAVLSNDVALEANDMIIVDKEAARDIFGYGKNEVSDIVLDVVNPKEMATIVSKIQQRYPNCKVITKQDITAGYENLFNYKGGIFLALFSIALLTFFMIVYDKASGLSSEEKREIGILKALGWRVEDILRAKFYEGFIVSCIAYIMGVIIAFGYVYICNAPLLRSLFLVKSKMPLDFTLLFSLNYETLFLLFFLSVPIYIAATILPSWRVATLDADEVMR